PRGHPRARKRLRSFHTVLHATAFAVAHGRKPAHDARTRRHSSHGAVSPTGARRSPYLQPARSKIATAAAFSSPSRARFSVSALNSPHARRISAGATRGFTGYSRFASEKIRCASSLARNSSSRIAFATFFELAVTPAPLTFTCAPRPSWFGKKTATRSASRRSSASDDGSSRPK